MYTKLLEFVTLLVQLQSLLPSSPLLYSSWGFNRVVTLEPWVVDDALAMYKGSGASLKAALQAYQCNVLLSVCHCYIQTVCGLCKALQTNSATTATFKLYAHAMVHVIVHTKKMPSHCLCATSLSP